MGRLHQPSRSQEKPEEFLQEIATPALGKMPALLKLSGN
jgi:hypothetical protein